EFLDLRPVFSRDVLRADVSAALQRREFDTCDLGKSLASLIRQVRIIFDVEHQHLRRIDFVFLVPRVVEGAAPKLRPIRIRNPVSISKGFTDVLGVVLFRSFRLLTLIQNAPVHNRAVCDNPLNSWIKRLQDCRRTAEASADDKDLIRCQPEATTECNFLKLSRQLVEDVENVSMWRFLQKLPAALPCSAIPWINNPKALASDKSRQRLLTRNRRHAIAQNDELLVLAGCAGGRNSATISFLNRVLNMSGIISYAA